MLYLHCGWLRTGTTSLQAAILAHREELAAAGIVYPDWWRPGGITDHHGLVDTLHKSDEEAGRDLALFESRLRTLRGRTVMISSESLTYEVIDERRAALLSLLAAAEAAMEMTRVWTLRNFADTLKSIYHRFTLTGNRPPSPEEFLERVTGSGKNWPEDMFSGLRALERVPGETVYLKYERDGSHSRELLRVMRFPPELRASIEERMARGPRMNPRLTQKGAVAIIHRDEISARAGFAIDKRALLHLFRRGEFRFEDDRTCNLFDEAATTFVHEQARTAARATGFSPYLEFFGDGEPEMSPPTAIDPDLLDDHDLDRLVDALQSTRGPTPEEAVR